MFCPKCGVKNVDTSKFCKACGKPLPDRSQIRQAVSPQFAIPQQLNLIGQVLDGKYRIEAKLGSGGMGDVYRATRILIGDTVAIKILHAHLAVNPQAAERFRHEAVTATKLRHRNIVAIYDVGIAVAYNVPYILMEIAEGLTLRQIINHSKILPLDFAVTVIAQICAALDEAHRLGIVHRDIKPENIIANQTPTGWHVKVLDFGIAKLYNEANSGLTLDGSAMGTPQYMSPEQCMGEQLDGRSDIYSVGIVLYEMLCGTVPFKNAATSAIAVHQVQTPPPPPCEVNPNVSAQVEAVILRALSKKREFRQQNAQHFSKEFIQAATIVFKTGSLVIPNNIQNNSKPQEYSANDTKNEPIAEKSKHLSQNPLENEKPQDFLSAPIPKPEDDSLAFEAKNNDSKDLKEEVSKESLKEVFEDAEMILDELFPNQTNDNSSNFDQSQPIIKPSEPLFESEKETSE